MFPAAGMVSQIHGLSLTFPSARGWQFVKSVGDSVKFSKWFDRGGAIEKKEFGVDKEVGPDS